VTQVMPPDRGNRRQDLGRLGAISLPAGRQRLDRDRVAFALLEDAVLAGAALAALLRGLT
jgi:hypothetical protein